MNIDLPTTARRRTSIPFACLAIASAIFFVVAIAFALWSDAQQAAEKSWVTLAKFGASLCTYAVTMQWLLCHVRKNLSLVRSSSIAACLGGVFVLVFLFIDALAVTLSGAVAHGSVFTNLARLAIVPPSFLLAVSFKSILDDLSAPPVLRTGLLWATGLAVLGCLPAVLMLVPEVFPGMPAAEALSKRESHEVLKTSHFVGLHALQILPIYCWMVSGKNLPFDRQIALVNSVGWALAGIVGVLTWKGMLGETLMAFGGLTAVLGAFVAFGLQKTVQILTCGNPLQICQSENL